MFLVTTNGFRLFCDSFHTSDGSIGHLQHLFPHSDSAKHSETIDSESSNFHPYGSIFGPSEQIWPLNEIPCVFCKPPDPSGAVLKVSAKKMFRARRHFAHKIVTFWALFHIAWCQLGVASEKNPSQKSSTCRSFSASPQTYLGLPSKFEQNRWRHRDVTLNTKSLHQNDMSHADLSSKWVWEFDSIWQLASPYTQHATVSFKCERV